jgi:hypothetical protein
MPKNQPRAGGKAGNTGTPQQGNTRSTANRKRYAERQAAKQQAALEARRVRNQRMAFGSIVLVLVIAAVLVIVKVSGGGGSSSGVDSPPAGTAVPAATMTHLASVSMATLKAAPASSVTAPAAIHDKALTADGKPELLFIGAEFCPICAAERWAMYVALSKFGTFSPEPGRIHSAVRDGDIPTLTFYKTTYSSPYFTFVPEETLTNHPDGDTYTALQTLTPAQQAIWDSHTTGSFPFLDFGGKEDLTTAQYDPTLLEGPSFDTIAGDIGNNSTTIGADVDASAELLVQTICSSLTSHKPVDVCNAT